MRNPPHPGEVIRDSCLGRETAASAARRMGASASTLSRVLNGRGRISPALAWKMERIGWSDAMSWMQMQAHYDLAQERLQQERQAA